ncbi:hypothetical protein FB451DRAFT_305644 [Mycena latifolia]|nr:hypothetical protein FB451DRAFT_305644 [Mycena latifolia]
MEWTRRTKKPKAKQLYHHPPFPNQTQNQNEWLEDLARAFLVSPYRRRARLSSSAAHRRPRCRLGQPMSGTNTRRRPSYPRLPAFHLAAYLSRACFKICTCTRPLPSRYRKDLSLSRQVLTYTPFPFHSSHYFHFTSCPSTVYILHLPLPLPLLLHIHVNPYPFYLWSRLGPTVYIRLPTSMYIHLPLVPVRVRVYYILLRPSLYSVQLVASACLLLSDTYVYVFLAAGCLGLYMYMF